MSDSVRDFERAWLRNLVKSFVKYYPQTDVSIHRQITRSRSYSYLELGMEEVTDLLEELADRAELRRVRSNYQTGANTYMIPRHHHVGFRDYTGPYASSYARPPDKPTCPRSK